MIEERVLPKFVCTECWTIILNFHIFYQAVERAELAYLESKVKGSNLRISINDKFNQACNRVVEERQIDPDVDHNNGNDSSEDEEKVFPSYASGNIAGTSSSGNRLTEPNTQSDRLLEPMECDLKEELSDDGGDFMADDAVADESESESDSCDSFFIDNGPEEELKKSKTPKASKATRISADKSDGRDKEMEDRTVAKYFDIKCDVCSEKFELVLDLHTHLKKIHRLKPHLVSCYCGRRYQRAYEMRDHVYFHINPDAFRYLKAAFSSEVE